MSTLRDIYALFSQQPAKNPAKPVLTGNYPLDAQGTPNNPPPYKDWNVINLTKTDQSYEGETECGTYTIGNRAINFRYIMQHGDIPDEPQNYVDYIKKEFPEEKNSYLPLHVEFQDPAFTQALNRIQHKAVDTLNADPEIQALFTKTTWSREDRILWEEKLSQAVSDSMHVETGLSRYRVEDKKNTMRDPNLDGLGYDIAYAQRNREFDCEQMSAVEGIILQQIEDSALPADTGQKDYKKASAYFYTGLQWIQNMTVQTEKGSEHAAILSSATGHIIEATVRPEHDMSPYQKALDADYTFDDFVNGKPMLFGAGLDYYVQTNEPDYQIQSTLKARALSNIAQDHTSLLQELSLLHKDPQIKHLEELTASNKALSSHPFNEMIVQSLESPEILAETEKLSQSIYITQEHFINAFLLSQNDPASLQDLKQTIIRYYDDIAQASGDIPLQFNEGNVLTVAERCAENKVYYTDMINQQLATLGVSPAPQAPPAPPTPKTP